MIIHLSTDRPFIRFKLTYSIAKLHVFQVCLESPQDLYFHYGANLSVRSTREQLMCPTKEVRKVLEQL